MKILLLILALINIPALAVSAENASYSLTIIVENLRNSKGVVQFALYNKEGTIPDEEYKKSMKILVGNITNGSASQTFIDLAKGRYAVNILHDEDSNGKIDKGFILPKEGIGFSNYHSIGLTNRPNFHDASFLLESNMKIIVQINYL